MTLVPTSVSTCSFTSDRGQHHELGQTCRFQWAQTIGDLVGGADAAGGFDEADGSMIRPQTMNDRFGSGSVVPR